MLNASALPAILFEYVRSACAKAKARLIVFEYDVHSACAVQARPIVFEFVHSACTCAKLARLYLNMCSIVSAQCMRARVVCDCI